MEGFRVASAYVEIGTKGDLREGILAQMPGLYAAGGESGRGFADRFTRDARGRLHDERGRFVSDGLDLGDTFGRGFTRAATEAVSSGFRAGFSGVLGSITSNPYVAAAAVALAGTFVAVLLPAIGALLSSAVISVAGLGIIGLGAFLLRGNKQIVQAGSILLNKVQSIFQDAAKPMIGPIIYALGLFRNLVIDLQPEIKQMFAAVAPAIKPLAVGLAGLVRGALPGFLDLLKASGPFLTAFAKTLPTLGQALSRMMSSIADSGPEAAVFFKDFMWFLGGTISALGMWIGWLTTAYAAVRGFFTSIPGWVSTAGSFIADMWNRVFTGGAAVVSWFAGLPGRIGGFFSSLWSTVTGWLSRTFTSAVALVVGWFNSTVAWFQALPGRAQAAFVALFDRVFFTIGFGIGLVIKFFMELPGKVATAVTSLPGKVAAVFTAAWTAARTWTSNLVTAVIGFLTTLPGRAWSAIQGVVARVSSVFSSAKTAAVAQASSMVSSVMTWVAGIPGRIGTALSTIKGRVLGAFSGASTWLFNAGQQIISGVISGISDMIGAAVKAVKRAVGSIVSGAKAALGIASPSKVFATMVGAMIPPGIVMGVQKAMPAAVRSVRNAVGQLVPGASGAGSVGVAVSGGGSGTGGGSTYVFGPGSVVLDLSSFRTLEDVVAAVQGLATTARQYSARGVSMAGVPR